MKSTAKNAYTEREIFRFHLSTLEGLETIKLPSKYFGLFLVCDADQIPNADLLNSARALLANGLEYVCTWGKDCERVHDRFDNVSIELNSSATHKRVLVSTWHERETLDQALWYFLYAACPIPDSQDHCCVELIVVVDNESWSKQIRERLLNQTRLDLDICGEKDDDEDDE